MSATIASTRPSTTDSQKLTLSKVQVVKDRNKIRLSDHIASRLKNRGTSRNFVIRYIDPGTTAESIRKDLNHIHQLEVVRLFVEDGHAWISLNSIQHAITAMHCMRSRLQYKYLPFQFCQDECDQPIHGPVKNLSSAPQMPAVCKQDIEIYKNRFDALVAVTSKYLDEGCEGSAISSAKSRA